MPDASAEKLNIEQSPTIVETVLKRDRLVIIAALAVITVIAWYYIVSLGAEMNSARMGSQDMGSMSMNSMSMSSMKMDGMPMPDSHSSYRAMAMPMTAKWTSGEFVLMFVMWMVMMIAMMVPSAAPLVLLFATLNRKRRNEQSPYASTGYFLAGYLIVWGGFSLAATLLQWSLQYLQLLSPMMQTTRAATGSIILIAAGIFQFTPLKNRCLAHCRTPIDFISRHWKNGNTGALQMGLQHGMFCLGCCWVLMCILFVTGVMNIVWIAVISVFVLLEKLIPSGKYVSRFAGILLVANGIWLLM